MLGPKLGCAIVSDPLHQLTPRTLAALAQALQGGGVLVLVLLAAAAWEEVLPSSSASSPLALLLGRALVRLPQCKGGLLVLDGRLKAVQPILTALKASGSSNSSGGNEEEDMSLEELQASLQESPVVGELVKLARTADQARVLLSFFEPASERSLAGTVSVTGPPGRGKSAAVGLCLAGAVAYGYSNVFLTAASLTAAQSIFRFLLKGFDALGYEEGKDYELIQVSTAPSKTHGTT
jgi:N-acetyltransferase 10